MPIENLAEHFGRLQRDRQTLPQFAIEIAKLAKSGEIDTDDAMDIYIAYFKVSSGLRKPLPTDTGVKVNASKLRQIIKAASPTLLGRVMKLYAKAERDNRPLYPCMVDACRLYNLHNKMPTDAQLKAIVARRR
jgi:hypothetical protein